MVYVQERSRVVATTKSHARASATPATPHHFFPFPNALIPPHYCKYLPIDNPVLRLCTTLLVAMYGIIRLDVVSSGNTPEVGYPSDECMLGGNLLCNSHFVMSKRSLLNKSSMLKVSGKSLLLGAR
jgi:hypothetical protein